MESSGQSQARIRVPWRVVLKRMRPTMIVYFCNTWTTSLYFTWLPLFFMHGQHLNLMNSAVFSSGVFCAAVLGDVAGGLISDQILRRTGNVVAARQNVIVISLLGGLAVLARLLVIRNLMTIAAGLGGGAVVTAPTV